MAFSRTTKLVDFLPLNLHSVRLSFNLLINCIFYEAYSIISFCACSKMISFTFAAVIWMQRAQTGNSEQTFEGLLLIGYNRGCDHLVIGFLDMDDWVGFLWIRNSINNLFSLRTYFNFKAEFILFFSIFCHAFGMIGRLFTLPFCSSYACSVKYVSLHYRHSLHHLPRFHSHLNPHW